MKNKKRKFLGQNLSWFVSGALVALLLLSIGPVNGAGNLQGFLAKLIQNRIDTVIENNLAGALEQLEGQEEKRLGGLVEVFQKIFPEGLVIGTYEKGNSKAQQIIVDSSNNFYIGSSTDATFKIDATTGRITMRNTNFTTSSLNWGGDLSVDSTAGATPYYTFFADQSTGRLGVGTSTPVYQLEVANGEATTTLALTATSTNDAVLKFNIGYDGGTAAWLLYADNSDGDKFKIGTSTDRDILTIDGNGDIILLKSLKANNATTTLATTTVGSFVQGGSVMSTTTGPAGTLLAQDVCSNSVIQVNPLQLTATLTLPATTTLYSASGGCLLTLGDTRSFAIHNSSTTDKASAVITITAGTGIEIKSASSTAEKLDTGGITEVLLRRVSTATTVASIITSYDAD